MYNLEDFETWLAEKEDHRENISQSEWNKRLYDFKVHQNFTAFLAGEAKFATEAWQPYRPAVLKWKAEIDNGSWNSENSAIAKLKKEKKDLQARLRLKSEQEAETLHELDNLQMRLTDRLQALAWEQAKAQELQGQLQAKEQTITQTNQVLTQQKTKWTQYIQQTKSWLTQEIQLIKEVLND